MNNTPIDKLFKQCLAVVKHAEKTSGKKVVKPKLTKDQLRELDEVLNTNTTKVTYGNRTSLGTEDSLL
jgi:hypothetical protein